MSPRMSQPQALVALAGRNPVRAPEGRVFRSVCPAAGGLCVPVFAEGPEEALAVFRELGFEGMSLLERIDASAAAMLGLFPSSMDTFVSDGEGAAIGFDAAAATGGPPETAVGAESPGKLETAVRRAIAALERILDRRLWSEYPRLLREVEAAEKADLAARTTAKAEAAGAAAADAGGSRGIALVGLMAAGKSETGRLLAQRRRLPFLDSDQLVESRAGLSVAQIFAREGEAGFRAREKRALEEAESSAPCVLALGGGAVLAAENRALLSRSFATVWLHVTAATAARRSTAPSSPVRPLLGAGEGTDSAHDRVSILRGILEERRELYAVCADLLVSTEGRDPAAVAEVIDAEIGVAR